MISPSDRADDARIREVPLGRSEPGLGDFQLSLVDLGFQVGLLEGVLRGHLILVEVDLPLGGAFRFLEVGPGHLDLGSGQVPGDAESLVVEPCQQSALLDAVAHLHPDFRQYSSPPLRSG